MPLINIILFFISIFFEKMTCKDRRGFVGSVTWPRISTAMPYFLTQFLPNYPLWIVHPFPKCDPEMTFAGSQADKTHCSSHSSVPLSAILE